MSVLRNLNIISQMRLDVPHFRLFESGVRGDFDTVVGRVSAGGRPLVVRGFTIQGGAQVVSTPAKDLQLSVADGIVVNLNASESGSFLWVPPDRPNEVLDGTVNASVVGAFVSGAVNYVGIDFVRETADSTIDLVKFKDPVTGAESSELVPLGEVLEYRILIGTVPFSVQSNIVPVAKVTVDYTGVVDDVTDARDMLFRLGSGGDFPNPASGYGWPGGRTESYFTGADKSLNDQKSWNDAIMTRLWELGGGQHWFDNVSDRNVKLINTGSPYSNGEYFTFNSGTGATEWQGLRLLFDGGSTGVTYNDILSITGTPQTVADGSCVYVDIDRTTNATLEAQVGPLATVGTGTMPGSRWILAWRNGSSLYIRDWRYPVGTLFTPATDLAQGVVKLHSAAPVPANPIVAMIGTNNTLVLAANAGNSTAGSFTGFGQGNGLTGVSGAVWSPTGAQAGVRGTGTAETEASGVFGMGAATSTAAFGGYGVKGTGGNATNTGAAGAGGSFAGGDATLLGTAAGDGILATGGTNSADAGGVGGRFTGGYGPFGSGPGVVATGAAGAVGSPGVTGEGTTDNAGVVGTGHGTGAGVEGTGGSGGDGVKGSASGATSAGVHGVGTGGGVTGVKGEGGASGIGVHGVGGAGNYGGDFYGGTGAPGLRASRNDAATASPAFACLGTIDLDGSTNPTGSTALKNKLTRMAFAKALGIVTLNNTASPSVAATQNCTVTGTATSFSVTFAQAMAADYVINPIIENPTAAGVGGYYLSVTAKSTTGFTVTVYKYTVTVSSFGVATALTNTAAVGSEASGLRITFTVFGDQ
jgi:hypothetical protein